jgi:hypothetical protein
MPRLCDMRNLALANNTRLGPTGCRNGQLDGDVCLLRRAPVERVNKRHSLVMDFAAIGVLFRNCLEKASGLCGLVVVEVGVMRFIGMRSVWFEV